MKLAVSSVPIFALVPECIPIPGLNERENFVVSPTSQAQYRTAVSPPNSDRPPYRQTPKYNPAISVPGEQSQIFLEEMDSMYLSQVSTKDV